MFNKATLAVIAALAVTADAAALPEVKREEGLYQPLTLRHNGSFCVDVAGNDIVDGSNVILYTCNRQANQLWKYLPYPKAQIVVTQGEEPLCLTGGDGVSRLTVRTCNEGQANQMFVITGSSIRHWHDQGLCMDLDKEVVGDGTPMNINTCRSDVPVAQEYFWAGYTSPH